MNSRVIISVIILAVAILAFGGLAFQTVPVSTTITITQESTESKVSYSSYMVSGTQIQTVTFVGFPLLWSGLQNGDLILTSTGGIGNVNGKEVWCAQSYVNQHGAMACGLYVGAAFMVSSTETTTSQLTYTTQNVAMIPFNETLTQSTTQLATVTMPESEALGLTQEAFNGLAILVIGILIVVTIWVALKSRWAGRKPKQPKITEAKKVEPQTKKATIQKIVVVPEKVESKTKTEEKKVETITSTYHLPPSKRLCIKCGNELAPNLTFCNKCGTTQP